MPPISPITDGEVGLSVRNKLNEVITAINNGGGGGVSGTTDVVVGTGQTIAIGNIIRFEPTDSGYAYLATNASEAEGGPVSLGLALAAGTAGQTISVLLFGTYTTTGLTPGAVYFLGADGAWTTVKPTANGSVVRVVAYALSATVLWFQPDATYYVNSTGINAQSGSSYTLALGDAGGIVEMTLVSFPTTVNIPTNAAVPFPIGTSIDLVPIGDGLMSVTAPSGVGLNGVTAGSTLNSQGQFKAISLYKRGTDDWIALGVA